MRILRSDDPTSVAVCLADIRAFIGCESLVIFSAAECLEGWTVARLESDGFSDQRRLTRLLSRYLARCHERHAFYPQPTPATTSGAVVETCGAEPGSREAAVEFHREVLAPLELASHRVLSTLLRDGETVLAWVGAFQREPFSPLQHKKLATLSPFMKERLSLERVVTHTRLVHAALDLLLEHIGAACFLFGPRNELVFTNRSGRTMLDQDRPSTVAKLQQRLTSGRGDEFVDLAHIADPTMPKLTLAIVRDADWATRLKTCVLAAAARWQLTVRQRDVLHHVVRGEANVDIADRLGVSERAVELHLTAMFDRLGIDNRTSLVTRVLLPG